MADRSPTRARWWCLPSWLGLDAPCVVSTWTWAISRSTGQSIHARALAALFVTVWAIYLLDRLVDVRRCRDWEHTSERMRFGRRWRPLFVVCLVCCGLTLAGLLAAGLPRSVVARGVVVGGFWLVYGLLYVVPVAGRGWPGKEPSVGLFFALGAFAVLGYRAGAWPLFLAVALLVAFNCLVIAARDAAHDAVNDGSAASRWWPGLDRDLHWLGLGLTVLLVGAVTGGLARPFFLAAALSSGALTLLHRASGKLGGGDVRALADYALLFPWLTFFPRIDL